jgi:hypothetical protein
MLCLKHKLWGHQGGIVGVLGRVGVERERQSEGERVGATEMTSDGESGSGLPLQRS